MQGLSRSSLDHLSKRLVTDVDAGRQLGCIVKHLVPASAVERVLETAREARSKALVEQEDIGNGASILGCMLGPTLRHPAGPTLASYLDAAARWERAAIDVPLRATVHSALSALSGNRPVVVPRGHAPCTLRTFPPGTGAPVHCDTYPSLACRSPLEGQLEAHTQLSWYVVLAAPDEGGELTIFDRQRGAEPTEAELERAPRVTYAPAPGDLVVFDGGRYLHRIEPVGGALARQTLGGFAALAKGGRELLVWG